MTTLSWLQAVLFFAVHKGLQRGYLGCSFAPAHKGMPVTTPEQADDPFLRQVLTSRNTQHPRWTSDRPCNGWAELSDRALLVPEHADGEPPPRSPGRSFVLRGARHPL